MNNVDLSNVKVGDLITILRDGKFPKKIVRVEKVLKNSFKADGINFKFSGMEKSGGYYFLSCKPFEQSDRDYIKLRNKCYDVYKMLDKLKSDIYEMDEQKVDEISGFLKGVLEVE